MMENKETDKGAKRNLIINIVLMVILVILIVVLIINKYVLSIMRVSGESMMPTLHDKERVFVQHTRNVSKGDLIVFKHGEKYVVKRLIATAGDSVRIDEDGFVYVNDELIKDDYILDNRHNSEDGLVQYKIEEDMYFALGDNRCNSNDSHDYGPIKRENILGKIL